MGTKIGWQESPYATVEAGALASGSKELSKTVNCEIAICWYETQLPYWQAVPSVAPELNAVQHGGVVRTLLGVAPSSLTLVQKWQEAAPRFCRYFW